MSKNPGEGPDLLPWEQMPGETAKQYQLFSVYRDLGPDRTIDATLKVSGHNPGYIRHIERLSSKWEWPARALEWDRHLERQRLKRLERKAVQAGERHVGIGEELVKLARDALGQQLDKNNKNDRLWARTLLKYVIDGVKLERLALGLDTDHIKVTGLEGQKADLKSLLAYMREQDAQDAS